jgi:hypothetical protein
MDVTELRNKTDIEAPTMFTSSSEFAGVPRRAAADRGDHEKRWLARRRLVFREQAGTNYRHDQWVRHPYRRVSPAEPCAGTLVS